MCPMFALDLHIISILLKIANWGKKKSYKYGQDKNKK